MANSSSANHSTNGNSSQDAVRRIEAARQQEQLQLKLLAGAEPQTLSQQEHMSIKGQNARHLVMQRLMRAKESRVVILNNMVGPDDVDQSLQEEIQEECSKYGKVGHVIIYNERQHDIPGAETDSSNVIVKIFVEFSSMSGMSWVI